MANFIVPKNVKSRFEFFAGFGFKELGLTLLSFIIGILLTGLIFMFNQSFLAFLLIPLFGVAGFFIGKQDPRTGKNLMDLFRDFKDFKTRPRRYHFRFGEGRK